MRHLKRILALLIGVHALLLLGLVYLHFHQELLVFQPFGGVRSHPEDYGVPCEEVFLGTSDGVRLHGWFLSKPQPRGTVLYFHGNAGNITDRRLALDGLLALDFDVFIFDYRGFGASTGSPTEAGTYVDAARAWSYLVDERRIPPDRVVLWGRSLGGAIATQLATKVKPAALVLESTFTSLPDLSDELYWIPDKSWVKVQYPTLKRIERITVPYLEAHSKTDDLIGYHHGLALFAACPSGHKRFIEIGGTHRSGHLTQRAYRERVHAFFQEILPLPPPEQID